MSVQARTINDALVYVDGTHPHRMIAGVGPVAQMDGGQQPAGAPYWTATAVGTSTAALGDAGAIVLTTDSSENDGIQIQWNHEMARLTGDAPCYFGAKLQVDEATESDFLVGLAITDTTLLGGVSDGAFFRKVDGSTAVQFVTVKDSVESAVPVATCAADTDAIYEISYDGANLYAWVDGVQVVAQPATLPTVPDDEELAPSIAFLTGAASAQVMTVAWVRSLQVEA